MASVKLPFQAFHIGGADRFLLQLGDNSLQFGVQPLRVVRFGAYYRIGKLGGWQVKLAPKESVTTFSSYSLL